MLLIYLFFFLSPSTWSQNLTEMIGQNPLLAKMSMFQNTDYLENSTIPLPQESEEDDFIRRMSTKRSPTRETVSDNFDDRYFEMNATLFDQAIHELSDLDYSDFSTSSTSDDVDLQKAVETETTTPLFSANLDLFETPVGSTSSEVLGRSSTRFDVVETTVTPGLFAKTSPYFQAFQTTTTSEPPEVWTSETPIILSKTTEEEQFFEDELEDISSSDSEDVPSGISTSSFQGSSFAQLEELPESFESRKDENEVTQFNGKYSVSATKYYVDNRIDGEHYEQEPDPEPIEDTLLENGVEEVDPFAVEREMRKMAKMHAAKTQTFEDPLVGLEMMMTKDFERKRLGEETPESETVSMETDKNGNKFETRETVYKGQKTTVNLWNQNLHGHDLMRFPGAIFDDRIDEPRRKSDKRRAVASRIVLSNDEFSHLNPKNPRLRKVVAGVTTNLKNGKSKMMVDPKELKITEDVESVCFNSKKNTALVRISPFETDDNLTKLDCLVKCAKTPECYSTTYSVPLATCAMYRNHVDFSKSVIRSQGHSLHRKLSKTTERCVRMFVSKDIFDLEGETEDLETESSPAFLRLVEKDSSSAAASSPLFSQRPRCPGGQDVIFIRSNDVEASRHQERRDYVEISEDDCVFACLTNTRPGGGTSDCTAIEYDKTRGFCYLMTSPINSDVAMTPRPMHPVNVYEKTCIQQSSANKCSGGQPIRQRQKVLIGHLVDAHSVPSAAECVDLCIEKHAIGCVSVMFYAKETTLNCILNDSTNLEDPASFFDENNTIVDFFSIQDCLGIREVDRRAKKRLFQNRIEKLARLRRKMARL